MCRARGQSTRRAEIKLSRACLTHPGMAMYTTAQCWRRLVVWRHTIFLGSSTVERAAVNRAVRGSNPLRGALANIFPCLTVRGAGDFLCRSIGATPLPALVLHFANSSLGPLGARDHRHPTTTEEGIHARACARIWCAGCAGAHLGRVVSVHQTCGGGGLAADGG